MQGFRDEQERVKSGENLAGEGDVVGEDDNGDIAGDKGGSDCKCSVSKSARPQESGRAGLTVC